MRWINNKYNKIKTNFCSIWSHNLINKILIFIFLMLFICFCYFSVLFLFSLFFPFLFSCHNFDQSDGSKKFRKKKNVWKFFIELFRLIYLNFSGNYPNLLNKNFWEMKKKRNKSKWRKFFGILFVILEHFYLKYRVKSPKIW